MLVPNPLQIEFVITILSEESLKIDTVCHNYSRE